MAGTEEPVKPAPTTCNKVADNVIRFQPRASAISARQTACPPRDICQILSLSKYEQPCAGSGVGSARVSSEAGSMRVSVSALIFTVTLAVVGAWIAFDLETRPSCASVTMCPQRSRTASF
jgi:hypothetical protein